MNNFTTCFILQKIQERGDLDDVRVVTESVFILATENGGKYENKKNFSRIKFLFTCEFM